MGILEHETQSPSDELLHGSRYCPVGHEDVLQARQEWLELKYPTSQDHEHAFWSYGSPGPT